MNNEAFDTVEQRPRAQATRRLTLLALLTPITIEGLAMGDAMLFSKRQAAVAYVEHHPVYHDPYTMITIDCVYGRG